MNASFSFFLVGVLAFLTFGCSAEGAARILVPISPQQETMWTGTVNGKQIVWTDDDIQITPADSSTKPCSLLSVVREVEQSVAKRIAKESPETIGKPLIVRGRMRILSVVGDVLSVEVSRSAWVEGAGASTTAEVRILNLDLGAKDVRQAAKDQLQDISTTSAPSLSRFVPERTLFSTLSTTVGSANCDGLSIEPERESLDDLLKASPCVGQNDGRNTFLDEQSIREFWLDGEKADSLIFRIAVYTQESRVLAKRSIQIIVPKKDVLLTADKLEESLLIDRQLFSLQDRYSRFDIKCYINAQE